MAASEHSISEVAERLFISSWTAAHDKAFLDRMGITHILNMTPDYEPSPEVGRVHLHAPIEDDVRVDLSTVVAPAVAFLREHHQDGHRKVLVHCNAGQSRSVSMVLAYLMQVHEMTLKDAYSQVKAARPCASPNVSFMRQLTAMDATLRGGESTFDMVDYTVKAVQEFCPDVPEHVLAGAVHRCGFDVVKILGDPEVSPM